MGWDTETTNFASSYNCPRVPPSARLLPNPWDPWDFDVDDSSIYPFLVKDYKLESSWRTLPGRRHHGGNDHMKLLGARSRKYVPLVLCPLGVENFLPCRGRATLFGAGKSIFDISCGVFGSFWELRELGFLFGILEALVVSVLLGPVILLGLTILFVLQNEQLLPFSFLHGLGHCYGWLGSMISVGFAGFLGVASNFVFQVVLIIWFSQIPWRFWSRGPF